VPSKEIAVFAPPVNPIYDAAETSKYLYSIPQKDMTDLGWIFKKKMAGFPESTQAGKELAVYGPPLPPLYNFLRAPVRALQSFVKNIFQTTRETVGETSFPVVNYDDNFPASIQNMTAKATKAKKATKAVANVFNFGLHNFNFNNNVWSNLVNFALMTATGVVHNLPDLIDGASMSKALTQFSGGMSLGSLAASLTSLTSKEFSLFFDVIKLVLQVKSGIQFFAFLVDNVCQIVEFGVEKIGDIGKRAKKTVTAFLGWSNSYETEAIVDETLKRMKMEGAVSRLASPSPKRRKTPVRKTPVRKTPARRRRRVSPKQSPKSPRRSASKSPKRSPKPKRQKRAPARAASVKRITRSSSKSKK
jgi:hypothetical protein